MRRIKVHPNQSDLLEIFDYCNKGRLYRKGNKHPSGSIRLDGYVQIKIDGKIYQLHRIIYIYHYGDIPDDMVIDHISGDHTDNRIENLQAISNQNNIIKRKNNKNNTSGYRGVSWNKNENKWKSYIMINNKKINLGSFENKEDAALAYDSAALEYHGNYGKVNLK